MNDELDYQVAALQQVAEEVGRAVKRSPTSAAIAEVTLPEPAANRSLKWSADGSRLVNSANDPDAAGDATVAAAQAAAAATAATQARDVILAAVNSVGDPLAKAANLADLPDASAARDNLGLGAAARRDIGNAPGNLVELDGNGLIATARLPLIESIPPGTVTAFAGASAPAHWLICDGAVVSRTTYAALFTVLGATFGAGDGSTTFALPDLRGRAAIGAGLGTNLTNRTIGGKIGTETHILSIAEMPSHSHGCAVLQSSETSGYMGGATATSGTSGSSGGNQAHNNMPPSLVLNFIIKT
nr:tail fiber protein [Magnetospirillum sulfuroxidans]